MSTHLDVPFEGGGDFEQDNRYLSRV